MRIGGVESGRRDMEILLNLAWASVAITAVCIWKRTETRASKERRLPFIALVMLIVVLFPVISVSDDLWSIQNPAETDTLQRRDYQHLASCTSLILPNVATASEAFFAQPDPIRFHLAANLRESFLSLAALAANEIANRPPPIA
jgi:hypothetical protein